MTCLQKWVSEVPYPMGAKSSGRSWAQPEQTHHMLADGEMCGTRMKEEDCNYVKVKMS